ncbi:MAG: hypothetical protein ACXQTS_04385 [Candidatus Methanospirareceae archaeon]
MSEAFTKAVEETKRGNISQETTNELIEHVMRVHAEAFIKALPDWFKGTFSIENLRELITWGEDKCILKVCNDIGDRGFRLEINKDGYLKGEGLEDFFKGKRFGIKFYRESRELVLLYDDKEVCEEVVEDIDQPEYSLYKFCYMKMIPYVFGCALDGYSPFQEIYMLTDSRAGFIRIAPSLLRSQIIEEHEGLKPEYLRVYRFEPEGKVEGMKITEDGIDEVEFSSVIMELSNRYAEIEELRWKKLYGR